MNKFVIDKNCKCNGLFTVPGSDSDVYIDIGYTCSVPWPRLCTTDKTL